MTNNTQTTSSDLIRAAFQIYLENSTDMIFVKDMNLVYQSASQPFMRMVGKKSVWEIVGRNDFEIFEDQELAKRYTADDRKLLAGGTDLISYVEPLLDDHGHARYSSTSKYILRNPDGEPIGILGVSHDITTEYVSRRRHQQELKYLFELPEDTYAALFMDIDDWRIIRHQRHKDGPHIVTKCDSMEDFASNAIRCLADPNDAATHQFYSNLTRESMTELCGSGARTHTLEYERVMPNGDAIWVRTDINFLIDPENGHLCAIWTLRDIDKIKQESLHLIQAAERDEMTGLLNRASTRRQIIQALESGEHSQHALFIIDIDNFKSLNDTYGHQAGDKFLISLAKTLRNCFRDNDIVGRIGGDEFFVLMKNVPSTLIVAGKAQTLLNVSKEFSITYPDLNLSLSMGISMAPVNGRDIDTLYASADKALYLAKNKGKSQYVFANTSVE